MDINNRLKKFSIRGADVEDDNNILEQEYDFIKDITLNITEKAILNFKKDNYLLPVIMFIDRAKSMQILPLKLEDKTTERKAVNLLLKHINPVFVCLVTECWMKEVHIEKYQNHEEVLKKYQDGIGNLPDKRELISIIGETEHCEYYVAIGIDTKDGKRELGKTDYIITKGNKKSENGFTAGIWDKQGGVK